MLARRILLRLLQAVPTLIGVAVLVFVLVRVVPGDPVAMMIPPGASPDDVRRLHALYGLDRSIPAQFALWAEQAVTGNFGISITTRQSVTGLILGRLPATLELVALATLIAVVLGVALAVLGTRRAGRAGEVAVDAFAGFALAVPDFLWGLAFIVGFGVLLPLLPISGRADPTQAIAASSGFILIESLARLRFAAAGDVLAHMLMPATALALPLAAMIARVLKASLAEQMGQDYALLARVKGFSPLHVIVAEALRNAAIPTVSLTGVQVTFLVGGTVLIERIFSYPGIGNLAIDAVINRDLPLIQGLIITFAVLFILINLALDLSYAALDPRLRRG
ncbi:MAG: ABC transporter permease [Alphaproteobacteria bacterium]|nr:ABC transporter permease [Alphaproteobacteria bacterium]